MAWPAGDVAPRATAYAFALTGLAALVAEPEILAPFLQKPRAPELLASRGRELVAGALDRA